MITYNFDIPIYDIRIDLIQVENKEDANGVVRFMRAIKCNQEFIVELTENIKKGYVDGGETFRNFDLRKMLIIFYPMENEETRAEVYSHEKRHIEDRVMQHESVDDIESAGLLAGFLGRQFYKFWNKVTKK